MRDINFNSPDTMNALGVSTSDIAENCLDNEGNFERKADMFTKRTIKPHEPVIGKRLYRIYRRQL